MTTLPRERVLGVVWPSLGKAWRNRFQIVFAALALVVGTFVASGGVAQAADLTGSFRGNAYATYANATAGDISVELGRSALQPCPCGGTNGVVRANTVTGLKAGDDGRVLSADVTRSTVYTEKTASTAKIQNTSTISGLNLFDGLITATTVKAIATVNATTTTMTGDGVGSTFVDLKINNVAINANVAANTVIALPGLGKVTLKKKSKSGNYTDLGGITVQMLTVDIDQVNVFNIPVGARIIVASASAQFNRTQPSVVVGGLAYGTYANTTIGDDLVNKIGKAALITMGCEGTNGQTLSNNVATLDVGSLLSLDNIVSTAFGGPQNGGTVARMTSTVEGVSLLGGLIKAGTISAVAQETYQNGVRTRSTAGSGFVGLKIGLLTVAVNTPPNTTVPLAGLGYVIINEQIIPTSAGRTTVNGLHIFVTTANLLGLPVGSEIIIAHSEATANRS